MRKAIVLFFFAVSAIGFFSCSSKGGLKDVQLTTATDSMSYSLGVNIGLNLKQQNIDTLSIEVFAKAFQDAYTNGDSSLMISQFEASAYLEEYFQRLYMVEIEKLRLESETFMETNKTAEGVQVLESGLQYIVLQEGTGVNPAATDTVMVNYSGTFVDGSVFDASQPGQPAKFSPSQVIDGWKEALLLMKTGAKWKVFVPWNLGYGEEGYRGAIPPYSTLIFEIELLEVVK